MDEAKQIKSLRQLVVLHLFPGLVLSLTYILFLQMGILADYPKLILLGLAGVVTLVPLELGYLFYVAKKEEGSFNCTLEGSYSRV